MYLLAHARTKAFRTHSVRFQMSEGSFLLRNGIQMATQQQLPTTPTMRRRPAREDIQCQRSLLQLQLGTAVHGRPSSLFLKDKPSRDGQITIYFVL